MEKVEIPKEQYDALNKYFSVTTLNVLPLIKKMTKKHYDNLEKFINKLPEEPK